MGYDCTYPSRPTIFTPPIIFLAAYEHKVAQRSSSIHKWPVNLWSIVHSLNHNIVFRSLTTSFICVADSFLTIRFVSTAEKSGTLNQLLYSFLMFNKHIDLQNNTDIYKPMSVEIAGKTSNQILLYSKISLFLIFSGVSIKSRWVVFGDSHFCHLSLVSIIYIRLSTFTYT